MSQIIDFVEKGYSKLTNVVLLGGNGYIGRNLSLYWLQQDADVKLFAVSRSGRSELSNKHIINVKADCTNAEKVEKVIPEKINYIVDLIGRPEKDPVKFKQINDQPAEAMLKIAKDKNVKAMGFIGGSLGPSNFIKGKKRIAQFLKASGIRTVIVSPSVVYGNGRDDSTSRMVPLLKFFGLFNAKFKPVKVDAVAEEMVKGLCSVEN